jgi:uncharacterized protein (DUF427 family)
MWPSGGDDRSVRSSKDFAVPQGGRAGTSRLEGPSGVTDMTTATWNGATIAESEKTVVIEGNHYFPPQSVRREFLRESTMTSRCPWKGTAKYYSVVVDGKINQGAAWYYPEPLDAAASIKGHVAFWKGIEVK